jgi:hypothetical protein
LAERTLDERVAAAPNDLERLRLVAAELDRVRQFEHRLRVFRDDLAHRCRDAGLPMQAIADASALTDSYAARRLIARGAERRRRTRAPGQP